MNILLLKSKRRITYKIFLLSFFIISNVCSQTWHAAGLSGQIIETFGINSNTGGGINLFAGTDTGGVFVSTNNGTSWTALNSGLHTGLSNQSLVKSFAFIPIETGDTNIFLGTWNGVFLSTNNGLSWTAVNSGLTNYEVHSLAFSPNGSDGTNIYAGTWGGLFYSTNNGANWYPVNNVLTNTSVTSLLVNGTNLFAGTDTNGIFLSTDSGKNWTAVGSGLPMNVESSTLVSSLIACPNGLGGTNLFAGTERDGIFLSTNNGESWVYSGLADNMIFALLASPNGAGGTNLFAGTETGVYISTNNGTNWTSINTGLPSLTAVSALALSGNNLFAGTGKGVYITSITNLISTIDITNPATSVTSTSATLNGTVNPNGLSSTVRFDYGTTTSYGTSVTASQGPVTGSSNVSVTANLSGLTPNTLYHYRVEATNSAGTTYGADSTFTTLSAAQIWVQTNGPFPYQQVLALAFNSSGYIYAGSNGNGAYLTTDNGTNWTQLYNGLTNSHVRSLAINSSGYVFAGTDGGVNISTNNGANWLPMNSGLGIDTLVQTLAINSKGYVFAGTSGGGIFLSTNNGSSWSAVNNGLTNNTVHSLVINSAGYIFAGTVGGGVFLSTNSGSSWSAVNTGLTNSTILSLAVNSSGSVFAGTNGEGLFSSTNNGTNWTQIDNGLPGGPDVYSLVVNSAGYIFAGLEGSNLGVYVSTNNGSSWTLTGLSSYNVAALTVNSSGYVFAGTFEAGVFRTSNPTVVSTTPPAASTNSTTNISQTTATLNGVVNPKGSSTTVQFDYGITASYGSTVTASQSPVTGDTTESVSANISNLTAYTLYHYRVKAISSKDTTYGTDMTFTTNFNYPSSISLSQSYTFADPTQSSSFKLIGLPGNINTSLSQIITGTAKKDWNAYYDNGDTSNYLTEFNNSSTFTFKPGNGFWVISKNTISISQSDNTVTLNSDNSYSIALNNGWNIISNPFEKSVIWDSVISANALNSNLIIYGWNAAWTTPATFDPYNGYYFYNQQNLSSLKIPYNPNGTITKIMNKAAAFNGKAGTASLRLSLNTGSEEKSFVIISIDSTAGNDYDKHDIIAPPGDFEDAGMTIHNDKLSSAYKNLLKENRPKIGDGQTFDVDIIDKQKEKVTLKVEGVNNFKGHEVYLLDSYNYKIYNLKENNVIGLTPLSSSSYRVLIGNTDFINAAKNEILPKGYNLYQNYPNPFNPVTTIEYSIPKTSFVSLKVYDILGKEVVALVNEQQAAGYYRVVFPSKGKYSSGVYFYRIQVGSFTQTKKLLLMK
jgi:ligand-binding sensor domain-containing protein